VTTLGWLWRRRPAAGAGSAPTPPRPVAPEGGDDSGGDSSDSGGGRWLHLLPMLWPLLPSTWRARVPPPLHKLAVRLGVPLLEKLFKRRQPDSPAAPAA
jgi:hypothetical protein